MPLEKITARRGVVAGRNVDHHRIGARHPTGADALWVTAVAALMQILIFD